MGRRGAGPYTSCSAWPLTTAVGPARRIEVFVRPQDVTSPKDRWVLDRVLIDGPAWQMVEPDLAGGGALAMNGGSASPFAGTAGLRKTQMRNALKAKMDGSKNLVDRQHF